MSFQGVNEFAGIEWWNKYGNSSFPIRYKIEFSNLRYAQESVEVQELDKEENIEHVIFKPYDALVPNKDGYAKEYPVSFDCASIKDSYLYVLYRDKWFLQDRFTFLACMLDSQYSLLSSENL